MDNDTAHKFMEDFRLPFLDLQVTDHNLQKPARIFKKLFLFLQFRFQRASFPYILSALGNIFR